MIRRMPKAVVYYAMRHGEMLPPPPEPRRRGRQVKGEAQPMAKRPRHGAESSRQKAGLVGDEAGEAWPAKAQR